MFIAFEGPDNTGKSTSAANLSTIGTAHYNATKTMHAELTLDPDMCSEDIITYDRIDWLSHMVYRLALPDRDWNDDRPRTVFAMPDTHLVFKIHHPDHADFTADEVVDTPIKMVNRIYYHQADYLAGLNRMMGYKLFMSVTIIEVINDGVSYVQRVIDHDSEKFEWATASPGLVHDDETLVEFLRYVESRD